MQCIGAYRSTRFRQPTLWFLFLLCSTGFSQSHIRFDNFTQRNGLPQNTIIDLTVTTDGYVWVATQAGLARFDGYRFKQFTEMGGFVTCIQGLSNGMLAVATTDDGLFIYDPIEARFLTVEDNQTAEDQKHYFVLSLFERVNGDLLVGTTEGLAVLKQADAKTKLLFGDPEFENLASFNVTCFLMDQQQNLWIGTIADGIWILSDGNLTRSNESLLGCTALVSSDAGDVFIATPRGIYLGRMTDSKPVFSTFATDHSNEYVSDLALYDDKLWVASHNGLIRYAIDGQLERRFLHDHSDFDSLKHDQVQALFRREGVLFIGTANGLSVMSSDRERFGHSFPDPASSDMGIIYSIWLSRDFVLIGTEHGLFESHDLNHAKSVQSFDGATTVTTIQHRDDGSWILATNVGVYFLDELYKPQEHFPHQQNDPGSLSHDICSSLLEDRSGALWVGTVQGLNRLESDGETWIRYQSGPGSLSHPSITCLLELDAGAVAVGTWGGLNVIANDRHSIKSFVHDKNRPRSLGHNSVLSMLLSREGRVWLGTYGGGLNEYHPESGLFTRYSTSNGLVNDRICGLLEDNSGRLWISTVSGLSCFDPTAQTFRNYDDMDGLQFNEFNMGAYHAGPDNRLAFGGVNGINIFEPDQIRLNRNAPKMVITDFAILNESKADYLRSMSSDEAQVLSYTDHLFSFEFAALSFINPGKNKYEYQLLGWDADWIATDSHNRVATYTNIPAGDYIFRVRGSNEDGVWSNEPAQFELHIMPPPWKTWWAYLLYAIGLVLAMVGFVRLQRRELMRERRFRLNVTQMHQQFTRVFDTIDVAIFVFDDEKHLSYVNPNGCELYGVADKQLIGERASALNLESMVSDHVDQTSMLSFPCKEGQWRVNCFCIKRSGTNQYLLTLSDISQTVRDEEQRAWMRLIRVLSHEIKNHLTPISSSAQTIQTLILDPSNQARVDTQHLLADILTESNGLLRFLKTYESIARPPKLQSVSFNIKNLIESVVETFDGIAVLGDDVLIEADEMLLRHAVHNLVKNAVEACLETPNPEIKVNWFTAAGKIHIEIIDNGMGVLSPDNLFVPFYSTKAEGDGVGLVLSRQIVEAHKGTLTLENGKPSGAIATLKLPL